MSTGWHGRGRKKSGWLHKTLLLALPALVATQYAAGTGGTHVKSDRPPSSADIARAVQTPTSTAGCPNPEGGACLGALAAGQHTSTRFQPQLTYTVPAGWSNLEDHKGNYVLAPPGVTLAGLNAETGDYVGVAANADLADDCDFNAPPGVASTPSAFTAWLRGHPGMSTSHAHPILVGGLRGEVLDVRIAQGWTRTCPFWTATPVVPLMFGRKPSSFEHVVLPGHALRLYLLAHQGNVLRIEITDAKDAHYLDRYSHSVEGFAFKD